MLKLDHLGWVVEGTYKFGSSRVGVRTTSRAVGRWLDEILAAHRMTRWVDSYYSLVVAEEDRDRPGRRNLHVLYKGTVPLIRTPDLRTLARAFLEEIESHTFRGRRDAVYLEASLIAGPGGVAMIPSSFTPALGAQTRPAERLGLRLPGTTSVAIDLDRAEAVPIRSGLAIPEDAVERLVGSAGVPFDRFFLDRPVHVDAICLVNDRPVEPLEPVSRASVLHRFAAVSQNLPRIGGRQTLDALGRVVAAAGCYGVAPMSTSQVLEAMAQLTGTVEVRALT
jgi:hypothetical protein